MNPTQPNSETEGAKREEFNRKMAIERLGDVIYALWIVTTALEQHAAEAGRVLDKNDVRCAYNVMNDIGYTTNRPIWETRSKS